MITLLLHYIVGVVPASGDYIIMTLFSGRGALGLRKYSVLKA